MRRIIFVILILSIFASRGDAESITLIHPGVEVTHPVYVLDKITLLEMRIEKLEAEIKQLKEDLK